MSAQNSLGNFRKSVENSTKELALFQTASAGVGDFVKKSLMSVTNLPLATEAIASVKSLVGVLGLIPAVAGAAGLAVGTLKIAFSGFGDAMKNMRDPKKFAESIKEMPAPMQDTAKAVRDLLPQWDGLKKSVQSTMFQGLADQVKGLGQTYLPILNKATTATAGSFNRAGISISQFLRDPGTMGDMSLSMGRMSQFTDGFARALKPAVQIFVDFVTVGSEFLPAMGNGLANAAEKAAAFVHQARQTGKLKEWIQQGIDTFKALVATIINVGQILNGVLKAAGVNGEGFAQTLERITARIEAWVKSAEGQQKIKEVFDGLRNVAFALLAIMGPLSTVIFAIAGAFASLPAPVQQVIGQFIGWSGLVALVAFRVVSLATSIGGLLVKLGLWGSKLSFLGPKLLQLGGWVLGLGPKLLQLGGWLLGLGAKALLAAGRIAASWFIAMGPIGWVIAAVIGLVALIIANWDTVVRWTKQAWSAVSGAVGAAWDWVTRKTEEAKQWVLRKIIELAHFFVTLPDRIMGALGNLGNLLVGVGSDIVDGLWRGLSNGWNWLTGQVSALAKRLLNAAKAALGIGSPSKLFRDQIGRWIPEGVAVGITGNLGEVRSAAAALTDATAMGAIPNPRGLAGGRGGREPVKVEFSGPEAIMEFLRKTVRQQGGDVQLAFGGRR